MSAEPEPTPDELLAMAFVDGELDAAAAARFAERMRREPALAREVALLRGLELVARRMTPPEPADTEWERLARDPLQRGAVRLGFALALAGAVGLGLWSLLLVATSHLALAPRLCVLALGLGLLLVFLTVLRARLRTLPYDPYTEVER